MRQSLDYYIASNPYRCVQSHNTSPSKFSSVHQKHICFTSLFTSPKRIQRLKHSMMSASPVVIKQEKMPTWYHHPLLCHLPPDIAPTILTIRANKDAQTIGAIPFEDTWATCIHNVSNPVFTEVEWESMSPDEKYDALLRVKNYSPIILSYPDTFYTITTSTSDEEIRKILKKDCKILLQTCVLSQGYSNLTSQIESMLVSPLCGDLIKARDQLRQTLQSPPTDEASNKPQVDIPFVITHVPTDE